MDLNDAVRTPQTPKARLRSLARKTWLDLLSWHQSPSLKIPSLRCLYAHYVFDDQRDAFARHLDQLQSIGTFVSTDDAVAIIAGNKEIDRTYFHLSFDDGLQCLHTNASQALKARNIPAIVFVNPAAMPPSSSEIKAAWDKATNYRQPLPLMDWDSLAEAGFEIGAHTLNHRRLTDISTDRDVLHAEIVDCKTQIEHQTGQRCDYFAWPYGTLNDIDETALTVIKSAGYKASFGVYRAPVVPGQTDIMTIPRHHFEPQWPLAHVRYFAQGGMEKGT